jgi:hypothetical protein
MEKRETREGNRNGKNKERKKILFKTTKVTLQTIVS